MYNVQNFFDFFPSFTFAINIVAIFSKLRAIASFDVARLSLFEVNNIPNRIEILLLDYVSLHTSHRRPETN